MFVLNKYTHIYPDQRRFGKKNTLHPILSVGGKEDYKQLAITILLMYIWRYKTHPHEARPNMKRKLKAIKTTENNIFEIISYILEKRRAA